MIPLKLLPSDASTFLKYASGGTSGAKKKVALEHFSKTLMGICYAQYLKKKKNLIEIIL